MYFDFKPNLNFQVGESKEIKSFEWIIRDAPNIKTDFDSEDKDVYMIASFGSRLVKFVMKRIKGLRAPGQGV